MYKNFIFLSCGIWFCLLDMFYLCCLFLFSWSLIKWYAKIILYLKVFHQKYFPILVHCVWMASQNLTLNLFKISDSPNVTFANFSFFFYIWTKTFLDDIWYYWPLGHANRISTWVTGNGFDRKMPEIVQCEADGNHM